jgi:hypothetical protein
MVSQGFSFGSGSGHPSFGLNGALRVDSEVQNSSLMRVERGRQSRS